MEARGSAGPEARLEALDALLALFLLPLFFVLTGPSLSLTAALRATTLDAQVFAVDATFGLQPSFALPRLILTVPWLKTALPCSCHSLPIALALCSGLRSRRRSDAAVFNVFVALAEHAVTRHPLVPRNCMPSLHLAWALAIAWLARGTTLYDKGFYQLVRSRLAPGGVLRQCVQLHRISPLDIASVLASVRSQFRYVWLYDVGQHGIVVAAGLAEIRALHGGRSAGLLRSRVPSPESTDRLLATIAGGPDFMPLVSSDDNLFLEYSTPRGNVRRFGESLRQNVAWLMRFRPADPLERTDLEADDLGTEALPQAGR